MKNQSKVYLTLRILFATMLLIFGFNTFLQFMPIPEFPEPAMNFVNASFEAGFVFPFFGIIQILAGLSLLLNKFVPLSILLLAPFVITIILFHIFLDLSTIAGIIPHTFFLVYFAYQNRSAYSPLFQAHNSK